MDKLQSSKTSEDQPKFDSVNKYFGEKNFVQLPSALILHAIGEGKCVDLIVYSLLYSACFNRKKGDFKTKFNLSTICTFLSLEESDAKESLNRLSKAGHIKFLAKTQMEDDYFLEIWLSTRIHGFKKYVNDVAVS